MEKDSKRVRLSSEILHRVLTPKCTESIIIKSTNSAGKWSEKW